MKIALDQLQSLNVYRNNAAFYDEVIKNNQALGLFNQSGFTLNNLAMSMAYVILFVVIGIFFTFLVIFGGILALFQMTHVNELKEIKNDNIVISLLSSSILLGLALIMDQYVGHLCEAFVPYPDIISIH